MAQSPFGSSLETSFQGDIASRLRPSVWASCRVCCSYSGLAPGLAMPVAMWSKGKSDRCKGRDSESWQVPRSHGQVFSINWMCLNTKRARRAGC